MIHRRWLWLGICFRLDTAPSRHGPPMVSALRGGTIRKFKQATQAKANAPIGFKPGRCDGVDRGTMWRQYRSNRQFAVACPASPTFSTQFFPPKETLRTILPMRGNGGEACPNLTLAATLRVFPSRSRRARNPIGYARRGGGSCQPRNQLLPAKAIAGEPQEVHSSFMRLCLFCRPLRYLVYAGS